ncbi:MAG: glycosyltransferase family 2 protein [Gaiellaceae bacterium]
MTIVTPSFNQGEYLEETIRSVLDQDYPSLEYAVVDGGSSDGSVEIIRRYQDRLAWWTSGPDGGQPAALNRAFERATGEILGWVNSDDTLLPGAIARAVEELERDPELLLVYGDAEFVDEHGAAIFTLHARPFDVAEMLRTCSNHVVQPGSLFRRRALRPFNERAYYFFDFEWVLDLPPSLVRRIPETLATYRVHPESKSAGAPLRKARDYVRIADEFFPPGEREGRASAYQAAGEYFYDALELGAARRYLLRSLPRRPSARALSLLGKSLLPRPVVARLKERRAPRD